MQKIGRMRQSIFRNLYVSIVHAGTSFIDAKLNAVEDRAGRLQRVEVKANPHGARLCRGDIVIGRLSIVVNPNLVVRVADEQVLLVYLHRLHDGDRRDIRVHLLSPELFQLSGHDETIWEAFKRKAGQASVMLGSWSVSRVQLCDTDISFRSPFKQSWK